MLLRGVHLSGRPFVGLHASPMNFCSAFTFFLLRHQHPSLSLRWLDKERKKDARDLLRSAPHVDCDPACSCSVDRPAAPALRPALPSMVTPHRSFPSIVPPCYFLPLLLLCGPLRLTARALPRPRVVTALSVAN
jgi:hypothetical protein